MISVFVNDGAKVGALTDNSMSVTFKVLKKGELESRLTSLF